ncbi:MAG TPA: vitamin K epoxide reductase family protein [Solirubrobacteraceae bacterium]|nr:vitamin K epoxide reductase family protein [Solirubrobacteraceae bacterium]
MNGKLLVRVMLVLALIGLGDATYLTVVHYAGLTIVCAGKGNPCATVQSSKYSFLAGIPVALLGAIGYVLIIGSLLVRDREWTRLATLALALFGFGFSAYLTYRETFTIIGHPIYCEWCVGSAIILTVLLILSLFRYLRSPLPGQPLPAGAGPADPPAAAMPAPVPAARPPARGQQRRSRR